MSVIYNFLFPSKPDSTGASLLLLAARVLFGGLLLLHGFQKLSNFGAISDSFPDPLGVGSTISLSLAVFAEFFCSAGLMLGVLHRLVLIPMIFTMGMAFLVIHQADPFATKELAFLYLSVFTLLYFVGPGKYSIDSVIAKTLFSRKSKTRREQGRL